jgi:hypothetical protein
VFIVLIYQDFRWKEEIGMREGEGGGKVREEGKRGGEGEGGGEEGHKHIWTGGGQSCAN